MNEEPSFTHTDSLAIIQSMINKAKDKFSENGHLYLLWGWVVFFASVGEFILLQLRYEKHYLVWTICWPVVIYQTIYLYRKKKRLRVRTYTGDIIGYVWLSFVIMMFLMGFLFGQMLGPDYYKYINPVFLALYGIPTFLSGIILRFRPLVVGGISCWLLSVFSTLVSSEYQLLLLSAAMITAWIVPGYLLRARYKKTMTEYA
jgi:hypothetical protein